MAEAKALRFIVAGAVAAGIILYSLLLNTQSSQWNGSITKEGDVSIVENPSQPLFREFVFDLEEDLVMGGDPTVESAYFANGFALRVRPDEKGSLYVVDQMTNRVLLYDPNGKLIRMIGRQGQGPGEYQLLFDVFIGGGDIRLRKP